MTAYEPNEEGLNTTTWFRNNGLQSMIELVRKNEWTLEILMFAEEAELKQLCQDWNLNTNTTIKFLSAMRRLKQSSGTKDVVVLLGTEEKQILDNLINKKAKIKHDITQYQNAQNDLERDAIYITKQIHTSCDSMINTIEKYRKQLLDDLNNKKQQRMNKIDNGLNNLKQAFEIIDNAHKKCKDIAKDDQLHSTLYDMNEIARKHDVKSFCTNIDSNSINKQLTLTYDRKEFKNNLKYIVISFEADEKLNDIMNNINNESIEEFKIKEHEQIHFNSNFKSENGIILSENNKYCQVNTTSGGDVWIIADIVPVTQGKHCWRIYTINPDKYYVLWGVSEMKMYGKNRCNDTIYGITNRDRYWPFNTNVCKRDNGRLRLSKFMDKVFELDILIDCDNKMVNFRVVGIDNDDNNAWIMFDDKLGNIGWVPHFELGGCVNGPKLRICKIPIQWFGIQKKNYTFIE
eukprot:167107_1